MPHSLGGIFQSRSVRCKTRNRSFIAASSLGKWPTGADGPTQLGVQGLNGVRNRYEGAGAEVRRDREIVAYGATIRDRGTGSTKCGQADIQDELRARVSSWPPLRLTRLRCERGSVGVVSPHAPLVHS